MRPRFLSLLEPWLGSLTALLVPGYVFMLALGAIAGALMIVDRAHRAGFAKRDTLSVLMATYAAGLAGAFAVPAGQGVLAWLDGGRLAAPTGLAAYGGLVGGTIGTVIALRAAKRSAGALATTRVSARRLSIQRFLDAGAPAVALGIFFARIGCFLAGCDYGVPTTSVFGTTFPANSHAWNDHLARGLISPDAVASLPVHPTQLYEAAAGLLLWAITTIIPERTRIGVRFATLVVGYALLRSCIEMFRGDASRGHLGALSTAQMFAIVTTVVAALVLFLFRTRSSSSTPLPMPSEEASS